MPSKKRSVRRHSNGYVMTIYQDFAGGPFSVDITPLTEAAFFPAPPTLAEAQQAADERLSRETRHVCDDACTPWLAVDDPPPVR